MTFVDNVSAFRRLRILYNRMRLIGTPIYYSYWFQYTFNTGYGPRNVVICFNPFHSYSEDCDSVVDLYYEKDGRILFQVTCSRYVTTIKRSEDEPNITEDAIWKAIEEIEELTYPMINELTEEVYK